MQNVFYKMATRLYQTKELQEAYIRGCQNALSMVWKSLEPFLNDLTDNNDAAKKKDEWVMNMLIRQNRAVTQKDIDLFKQLDKTIPTCNFSTRTFKVVETLGVETIRDLVELKVEVIAGAKGCGRKTMYEINKFLDDRSLFLGMLNDPLLAEKYASWKAGGIAQ